MLFKPENVIYLKSVGSTNEYMIEQIRAGKIIQEGTVVIADEQTNGKGMDKNFWESEPHRNLTLSVLIKPVFLKADQQFILNKWVALSVYDFVRSHITDQKICIKWPNDIYINDSKVAGILINNTIAGNELLYAVAGIGININQDKFPGHVRNPVSLIKFLKHELNLETGLGELLDCLNKRYGQLANENFIQVDMDYFNVMYRLNEYHFYLFKNEIIYARISGVSEYGYLQLIINGSQKIECDFKEIEFIIQPALQ
jgi:BirA family biotin operon repressor/biotin-[acetyl-CoA-carboxylase] ligase